jgi:hypothetical protein
MINFLQLNQNFRVEEWNRNILNDDVFAKLHILLCSHTDQRKLKQFIQSTSVTYNKDKKHIIHAYLNHIIRNDMVKLTPEFMDMLENVVHSTNATTDDILSYMATSTIEDNR